MYLNRLIVCITIVINIFTIACQNQYANSFSNNIIDFIEFDTIQNDKNISLISSFDFEYGKLNMINTFQKDSAFDESNPFVRDLYIGFSIDYNDSVYSHIINMDCSGYENYFGVYRGDSIDNIEGFTPLVVKNDTNYFLIMEGYYYGCNGSFCNFGSILILKFKEKEIQQIYLFGIDKTIYSLNKMETCILDDEYLSLRMYSNNNDFLDLIFNNKIEFKDRELAFCESLGIVCIK
jgi:hypothetical protein